MANFTPNEIQLVWEKAYIVLGYDDNEWRKDQCGAWICRHDYGNRLSDYGWECDHIKPQSFGGVDSLYNIRPLHWKNNAARQNGRLTAAITSNGNRNVDIP